MTKGRSLDCEVARKPGPKSRLRASVGRAYHFDQVIVNRTHIEGRGGLMSGREVRATRRRVKRSPVVVTHIVCEHAEFRA